MLRISHIKPASFVAIFIFFLCTLMLAIYPEVDRGIKFLVLSNLRSTVVIIENDLLSLRESHIRLNNTFESIRRDGDCNYGQENLLDNESHYYKTRLDDCLRRINYLSNGLSSNYLNNNGK
jgi:hypothetical protein